ncbi:MAG: L-serine ammonia-lyase, iron-sulfur-dependent, subunit alpha, partial [Clostridia bacterium]|nr:L-serine ammonia-lyase, iron-sulfur-dependent, subunit alpha [Clostridia bacterium]
PAFITGKSLGKTEEEIVRAGMLSCLTTMYIKSYSGKLSALCGCAVAGGTGSAVALCHLFGGNYEQLCRTIDNMAASVVGMICHGGNPGCVMKALAGISSAFMSAQFALKDVSIENVHAILGDTPEKTMQNMAYISSPGMELTEKYILDIMKNK